MIQKQTGQIKINETLAEATYMFPDRSPPLTTEVPMGAATKKWDHFIKYPPAQQSNHIHISQHTERQSDRQSVHFQRPAEQQQFRLPAPLTLFYGTWLGGEQKASEPNCTYCWMNFQLRKYYISCVQRWESVF